MNDDYIEVDTDSLNTAGRLYGGTADDSRAIARYVRDSVQEYGSSFSPSGDDVGDTIKQNFLGPVGDLLGGLDDVSRSLDHTGRGLLLMGRTGERAETANTEVVREIENGHPQWSKQLEPLRHVETRDRVPLDPVLPVRPPFRLVTSEGRTYIGVEPAVGD